jgi:hypothetical protein
MVLPFQHAGETQPKSPLPRESVKAVLNMMSPRVRLPLVELRPESKTRVDTVMAKMRAEYRDYILADLAGRDRDTVRSINDARPRPKLVAASP